MRASHETQTDEDFFEERRKLTKSRGILNLGFVDKPKPPHGVSYVSPSRTVLPLAVYRIYDIDARRSRNLDKHTSISSEYDQVVHELSKIATYEDVFRFDHVKVQKLKGLVEVDDLLSYDEACEMVGLNAVFVDRMSSLWKEEYFGDFGRSMKRVWDSTMTMSNRKAPWWVDTPPSPFTSRERYSDAMLEDTRKRTRQRIFFDTILKTYGEPKGAKDLGRGASRELIAEAARVAELDSESLAVFTETYYRQNVATMEMLFEYAEAQFWLDDDEPASFSKVWNRIMIIRREGTCSAHLPLRTVALFLGARHKDMQRVRHIMAHGDEKSESNAIVRMMESIDADLWCGGYLLVK